MGVSEGRYEILPPAGWHALTPVYDLLCTALGLGKSFRVWLTSLADIQPEQDVLDLGCGTGVLCLLLLEQEPTLRLCGVEPARSALALARRKAERAGAALTLHEARAEALPFADGCFDRVICTLAFHHIPEAYKDAALREVRRVLRPDGRLILADFETHSSWLFWGKHRSKRPLGAWLNRSGFSAEPAGRRRGVHVYSATAEAETDLGASLISERQRDRGA